MIPAPMPPTLVTIRRNPRPAAIPPDARQSSNDASQNLLLVVSTISKLERPRSVGISERIPWSCPAVPTT